VFNSHNNCLRNEEDKKGEFGRSGYFLTPLGRAEGGGGGSIWGGGEEKSANTAWGKEDEKKSNGRQRAARGSFLMIAKSAWTGKSNTTGCGNTGVLPGKMKH